MATYQITKIDVTSQFETVAAKSITANLPWQDVCKAMEGSPDANIDYALAALKDNGHYSFHDVEGKLCEVLNHARIVNG